jgi:serine/threonine-protein kinase HipA
MVFNICMGNTDDHSRNHSFLYSFKNGHWRLSKAYDVLPINNTRQHGIGIGQQGRLGSIENAMSQAKRFGLNARKAATIINAVIDLTSQWASYFSNTGVSDSDIEILKAVIPE